MLTQFIGSLNNALYSYILVILLVVGGIYFGVRTKGAQFTTIGEQLRLVTEKPVDGKGVSPFHALMVSTASRVGTGNIIGVSTALCLGGFGSVFWMWVIALIGCASAFVESTLAQIYKKRGGKTAATVGPLTTLKPPSNVVRLLLSSPFYSSLLMALASICLLLQSAIHLFDI